MKSKIMTIEQAVSMVQNGEMMAIGGNTLNRAPMALVRAIAEAGKRGLRLVKTAGAMDVDLLCLAGAVYSVDAGFISYETKWGLAGFYRKAVESCAVKANEHACYTVISALRAASCGVPFMPVKGLVDSQLLQECDYFDSVRDPFSGENITVVRALCPDTAIIHVSGCDEEGNAWIDGPVYDDILLSRAARKVILTTEKLHRGGGASVPPERIAIPGFLVSAIVKADGGAWPCACYGRYTQDDEEIGIFRNLTADELPSYLGECRKRMGFRTRGRLSANA